MKRIDDIDIFVEIKRGEYGATYRGYEAAHQRLVLVKAFRKAAVGPNESQAGALFEQEAKIYAQIRHPNVVRLLRFGTTEAWHFLALEFIEGQNLRNLLQREGEAQPLPAEIALAIFVEILHGVAEIHRHNIIHRDLKPENILLGNDGRVKLCDFDLALPQWQLNSGALSGSPAYLAPETILGETVTPASDVFALGVLLFEMLAGVRPFQASSSVAELNAIVRTQPLPLSKVNPGTPEIFEALISRLLAKNPAQRWSGIAEVQEWLRRYFETGTAASRQQLVRKFLRAPAEYQSTGVVLRQPVQAPNRARAHWRATALGFAAMLVVLGGWRVWQANFASSAIAPSQIKSTAPVFDSLLTNVHETDQRLAQRVDTPGPAHAIGLPLQSIHPESSRARAIAELAGPPAARPLFFHSNPWAYLFINGDSLGMTPVAHALWAGGHEVALKHPRFPPLVFRLHVDARTPDTLLFSLWKQVGQLELHVTPWAEVFVNGQKRDFPPGSNTLLLLPGKHDLRFVHGELGEKTEQVYLQPGEVRRLDINMF